MLRDLFCLFPACAGVILDFYSAYNPPETFPRMRGGDPNYNGPKVAKFLLFPACAGVILPPATRWSVSQHFSPHARG